MNNKLSKFNKIVSITSSYFKSSLKTSSTWILISFNLFIMISLYYGGLSSAETILSYLMQATFFTIIFSFILLSLNSFILFDKKITGKGVRTAMVIFVLFILLFYGIALYMLFVPIMDQIRISLNFVIGIGILLSQGLLFFTFNIKKEKERLKKTNLVKLFFEPAGYIFPIYLTIIFMMIFGPLGLLIIIKTLADIIINSPLNVKEPYVYHILSEVNQ